MTPADYPLLGAALVLAMGLVKIIERLVDARKTSKKGGMCSDPPPACLELLEQTSETTNKLLEAQKRASDRDKELRDMFREQIKEQREFRVALERWIGRWEARMEADTGTFRTARGG